MRSFGKKVPNTTGKKWMKAIKVERVIFGRRGFPKFNQISSNSYYKTPFIFFLFQYFHNILMIIILFINNNNDDNKYKYNNKPRTIVTSIIIIIIII
jgi:hypothetical protein